MGTMLSRFVASTLLVVSIAGTGHAQPIADDAEPVDAAQVRGAIERGVAYLKREQNQRGRWDAMAPYEGGVTALCTLALLNSGVEVDDPVIQKALKYLRSIEPNRTYSVALQTMVFAAAEPNKDLLLIQRNVNWIEGNQSRDGNRDGAWSYPGAGGDNSNTQFAALALHEAQQVGAKVNPKTWKRLITYLRGSQNPDGTWGYVPGDVGSGSMTCACLGALVVATAAVEEGDAVVDDGRITCCRPHEDDEAIERALAWLGRNFTVRENPRGPGAGQPVLYYYLYGLERVGRLTARRFIGDHDWYREGAEFLVHDQDSLSHFWQGNWHGERNPHISTSLALLFLSKGRRPVVMGKLRHGEGTDWTNHRRDAANLTSYTQQAWDLDLSWQVFDPESATVEDLLQAPVLYISGSRLPQLMAQAQKLRDYVDRGGFLFAEAACRAGGEFDAGFRELIAAVFPEPEYRLRQMEPGHPIWRMEELVRPESPYVGRLWAVEYGCRTCVIYSEYDLSCYWELARPGRWREYPDAVVEQIRDALAVGINVLTYATNREPKGKEESFTAAKLAAEELQAGSRGMIEVAKLRHGGGCNDAPGALINLLTAAAEGDARLRVRTDDRMINVTDDSLQRYHLVFMHGRHNFRFTPAERDELRTFLENGGTLFVDAICASKPFATALRREIGLVLPARSLVAIPADDPLFSSAYGGFDLSRVTLREPQPAHANQPVAARLRQVPPQLEGVDIDGRWAVIFSPYDISCALEKHEAVECRGYTRQDAARIGLNVLLYSVNQ